MIAARLAGRLSQLRPELVDLDASRCRVLRPPVGPFATGCQRAVFRASPAAGLADVAFTG
jgi:hypothetical protein